MHIILKRLACDENTTMTALFIEMFDAWVSHYQNRQKPKDNFTHKTINEYFKKKKACK